MRCLKFSIEEIREHAGLSFRGSVEPAVLLAASDLPLPLAGPVSVELDFSIGASRVLLSGQFEGLWGLECGRCLAAFQAPCKGGLEGVYSLDAVEIDAGEELRQEMFLALPAKPLCRESCAGLCQHCGKNLNQGPCDCRLDASSPFEKLKSLKIEKHH